MADDDYYVPNDWYGAEKDIYDDLVNGDPVLGNDHTLQLLYDVALFDSDIRPDERDYAYEALQEYLWDVYDIDLDEALDWEAYREWYDSV